MVASEYTRRQINHSCLQDASGSSGDEESLVRPAVVVGIDDLSFRLGFFVVRTFGRHVLCHLPEDGGGVASANRRHCDSRLFFLHYIARRAFAEIINRFRRAVFKSGFSSATRQSSSGFAVQARHIGIPRFRLLGSHSQYVSCSRVFEARSLSYTCSFRHSVFAKNRVVNEMRSRATIWRCTRIPNVCVPVSVSLCGSLPL